MGIRDCFLDFGKFRDYFETAIHEPNGKAIIGALARRNPVEIRAECLQIQEFCGLFLIKKLKKSQIFTFFKKKLHEDRWNPICR